MISVFPIKTLRRLCLGLEFLALIGSAAVLFLPWVAIDMVDLGPSRVNLRFEPGAVSTHSIEAAPVTLHALIADIGIGRTPLDLRSLHPLRWAYTLTLFSGAIGFFGLMTIIRRLCWNAEQGRAFTLASVRLLRFLAGWVLLASWGHRLVEGWYTHLCTLYLSATVTFEGLAGRITPAAPPAWVRWLPWDLPMLFVALFVFVLAEIFRQGVELKQDNDLTV
jgi:hypothetical protein